MQDRDRIVKKLAGVLVKTARSYENDEGAIFGRGDHRSGIGDTLMGQLRYDDWESTPKSRTAEIVGKILGATVGSNLGSVPGALSMTVLPPKYWGLSGLLAGGGALAGAGLGSRAVSKGLGWWDPEKTASVKTALSDSSKALIEQMRARTQGVPAVGTSPAAVKNMWGGIKSAPSFAPGDVPAQAAPQQAAPQQAAPQQAAPQQAAPQQAAPKQESKPKPKKKSTPKQTKLKVHPNNPNVIWDPDSGSNGWVAGPGYVMDPDPNTEAWATIPDPDAQRGFQDYASSKGLPTEAPPSQPTPEGADISLEGFELPPIGAADSGAMAANGFKPTVGPRTPAHDRALAAQRAAPDSGAQVQTLYSDGTQRAAPTPEPAPPPTAQAQAQPAAVTQGVPPQSEIDQAMQMAPPPSPTFELPVSAQMAGNASPNPPPKKGKLPPKTEVNQTAIGNVAPPPQNVASPTDAISDNAGAPVRTRGFDFTPGNVPQTQAFPTGSPYNTPSWLDTPLNPNANTPTSSWDPAVEEELRRLQGR